MNECVGQYTFLFTIARFSLPTLFSLLPDFHYVFAAVCIWSYFGCGTRHEEAICT